MDPCLWGYLGEEDDVTTFVLAYLSAFIYDLLTSWILYVIVGFSPLEALIVGLTGLFVPVAGGTMFFIGPITEGSTALAISFTLPKMRTRTKILHNAL